MATRIDSNLITARAMAVLENELEFCKTLTSNAHSKYLKQLGNTAGQWSKPGSLIQLRYPYQFNVFDGNDQTSNFQTPDDTSYTFNLESAPVSVPMQYTDQDLTLNIGDFEELVIKPAMVKLAQIIEKRVLAKVTPLVSSEQGTPGSVMSDDATVLAGQAWLTEHCAPYDDRFAIIDPRSEVALVKTAEDLFNPNPVISEQFKTGQYRGTLHGAEFLVSNLLYKFVPGTAVDTTAEVDGGSQSGATLDTTGWGAGTITEGTIITIDGVNDVNPATKEDLGYLKQFSVVSTVTASGDATLTLSPAIVGPTSVYQNVTALPADHAAISIISGTVAGKGLTQNLLYHRDAFAFCTVPLDTPSTGVIMSSMKNYKGIFMRFVSAYDINTAVQKSRFDVLWGAGLVRPEFATRLTN